MMFEELAKMLSEIIQKTCVTLQEFAQQLSRLLGSASDEQSSLPFLKPYHCRVCGRRYMTAREAGNRMLSSASQSSKEPVPSSFKPFGKLMLFSEWQPLKQLLPIERSDDGSSMVSSNSQLLKA